MLEHLRTLTDGELVEVHWHLRKLIYSIKAGRHVVAYLPSLALENVRFRVSKSGRDRGLREKRRNVHAFAVGNVSDRKMPAPSELMQVRYNPYECGYFFAADTREVVRE